MSALTEETYSLGRVVKNSYDTDGDLQQVQSKKVNDTFKNYANSFNYTAAGAVSSMRLGNGRWENMQFNSRLQPTQIGLGMSAANQGLLKLDYEYGELQTNGSVDTLKNNGNIAKQTLTVPNVGSNQGFTSVQTYNYDSLNRLKDAKEMISTTQTWKQTFQYDRYGNRRFDQANTTFPTSFSNPNVSNPNIDTSNNRFTTGQGYTYDLSGNLITDAEGRSFFYDAENKQKEAKNASNQTLGEYFYDGDGKRVKKHVPNTGETTIFVYNASGKMVAEYSTIVEPQATAKISYLTNDHLGSPRIITDQNGAVVSRRDFMPFGEEIYSAQRTSGLHYTVDNIREKFATYERDTETDLDFAQARFYAKNFGRFNSIDFENAGAFEEEPQSWNGYSYVGNNPINIIDPTGLIWLTTDGKNYTWVADDYYNSEAGQERYSAANGWRVGNGDIVYIGNLEGSADFIDANKHLIGNFAYANSDGTLSFAGTRDSNGAMLLPVAGAAITIEIPVLAGGGSGAVGGSGVLAGSSSAILPVTVIAGGTLASAYWLYNYFPSLPAQPTVPNSSTSVTNTTVPPFVTPQNCACAVPVINMAKGGKQNIRNEWNTKAVNAVGNSVAAQIAWLAEAYGKATDSGEKQKIKKAQKAIGGRKSSGGGGN